MPKLADTLVEGTVGQWLKRVGEHVQSGEPLASIETDKVTTELTSPAEGTLLELLVSPGATVPIETPIARIGRGAPAAAAPAADAPSAPSLAAPPMPAGAASPDASAETARAAEAPGADAPSAPSLAVPPKHAGAAPPRVTPVAARLLAEYGLAAEAVPARGPRLTKQDVLAYVQTRAVPQATAVRSAAPLVAPAASTSVPLTGMRRAIAEHMVRARQTIPHGQTVIAADLSRLVAWRDQYKGVFQQTSGARLTFTVLFVHALARTLAPPGNVGVAVALDAGLIVPVLRHANALTLEQTAQAIADLAARARTGRLAPDATQGATMTVTNVGSFGNVLAAPIVPVGQAGILGPGVVERRPLPAPDGGVRLGWQCLLSFMFDRRAFDDLAADRFLRGVIAQLTSLPDR